MIITRTPFRISFFGGGTDYPIWYKEFGGATIGTTIDKYCYITLRYLPPFFDHKHKVVYSKIEKVQKISEINHPVVREGLKMMEIENGIEIHHDGDLPARAGLGSSSSFCVGFLHSMHALKGKMTTKQKLAEQAIKLERDVLKENVGSQDQVFAAFGGLNRIQFRRNGTFVVEPITIEKHRLYDFKSHLMLYFTGFSRYASEIAKSQINNTKNKKKELSEMFQMVNEGVKILSSERSITDFGRLLNETWQLKKTLSDKITTSKIDEIYNTAMRHGAIGGKILGAGGGGFMLLFVRPEYQPAIKKLFSKLLLIDFNFEELGSQIIFYHPNGSYL